MLKLDDFIKIKLNKMIKILIFISSCFDMKNKVTIFSYLLRIFFIVFVFVSFSFLHVDSVNTATLQFHSRKCNEHSTSCDRCNCVCVSVNYVYWKNRERIWNSIGTKQLHSIGHVHEITRIKRQTINTIFREKSILNMESFMEKNSFWLFQV